MIIEILSSKVRSAFSNFSGTLSFREISIVRHQLSGHQEELPSLASTTVESGLLNRGKGESKTGVIITPAAIRNIFSFLFNFPSGYFYMDFPETLNSNLQCTLLRTRLKAGKILLYRQHSVSVQKFLSRLCPRLK